MKKSIKELPLGVVVELTLKKLKTNGEHLFLKDAKKKNILRVYLLPKLQEMQ